MTTVPQVAGIVQQIFGPVAQLSGRLSGFVQRSSKFDGAALVRTLVFGFCANPQATTEELAQAAAASHVSISPQGIEQRLTAPAAACLKGVLDAAASAVVCAQPAVVPLLERFHGVYILDSTTIRLPPSLASVWPGCGNRVPGSEAALKAQVRLEFCSGALDGPTLQAGRAQDRTSPWQMAALPAGALRLADLGYFSLPCLSAMTTAGVFWISRLPVTVVLSDISRRRLDLLLLLRSQRTGALDRPVLLGTRGVPARLLAWPATADQVYQRRQHLREEARRRHTAVNPLRWQLAQWTIYVTNAPVALLSGEEAKLLATVRWQIEELFKLWKSYGRVDKSQSAKPWRILCEIYAKLLAMILQHWLFLATCWMYADRSLMKACRTLQKYAFLLAESIDSLARLIEGLALIKHCLQKGCRINRRRTEPATYQCLNDSIIPSLA